MPAEQERFGSITVRRNRDGSASWVVSVVADGADHREELELAKAQAIEFDAALQEETRRHE